MSTFANSEDPDKMQQCLHCLLKVKNIHRQKNTIYFENYNLTLLDMINGLSVLFIKPE